MIKITPYNINLKAKSLDRKYFSQEYQYFQYHMVSPMSFMRRAKILISDNGINLDLPVFKALHKQGFLEYRNFTTENSLNGDHGTHMATTAATIIKNGENILHGCFDILIAKVLKSNGYGESKAAIEAIKWGIDCNVNIINTSFGTDEKDPELEKWCIKAANKGILINSAGGNDKGINSNGYRIDYPGALECVNATGSIGISRNAEGLYEMYKSEFSDVGKELNSASIGENVTGFWNNDSIVTISGTSSATANNTKTAAIAYAKGHNVDLANFLNNATPIGDKEKFGKGIVHHYNYNKPAIPIRQFGYDYLDKNGGCNISKFFGKWY